MNSGWSMKVFFISLLCVVAVSGCYEAEPRPRVIGLDQPMALPATQAPPPQYQLAGRSLQGRPIMARILGEGEDTTLIMATIHGSEAAGTPLVRKLADHLRDNPQLLDGRRVVLLPVANPDGMAAGTRENARGIDLNRNFQANNRVNSETNGLRPLSEPESRAIQIMIQEYSPDRIVSIHEPLNCIDYDGPARALAARMAQYCDLPIKKLGAKPGSLGAYTGEKLEIPTITLELPPGASALNDEVLWDRYGKVLLAAVVYPQHAS